MNRFQEQPHARRCQFIQFLMNIDEYWLEVLGDKRFHDLNYYDLFTQMWLKLNTGSDNRFRKSDLYMFMPNISQRTAIKYIQIAIDHGLLIEHTDPEDMRSRWITMSHVLKQKIEQFLDHSISVFDNLSFPSSK